VLSDQIGSRSIQVAVNDRGPFTGAFLDLSPAAAIALGCRCTHRNVTATVEQMGSGGTVAARRGRQRPSLRQPRNKGASNPVRHEVRNARSREAALPLNSIDICPRRSAIGTRSTRCLFSKARFTVN
jgi:rare lipoprotein A (peptidoglycan hydrolase)